MINRLTSTSFAAKDSIKEHWKTVVTVDQCRSIAKCGKRQSTLHQPIEVFVRFSMVLLRLNKQRKDCLTFILCKKKRIVEEDGTHTKPLHL